MAEKNIFTKAMARLYNETDDRFSAPVLAGDLHRILKSYSNNRDPYKEIKKLGNDSALKMYPLLKKQVSNSDDSFQTALRLAIAGNIIDYAVGNQYDLEAAIQKTLNSDFAIDHSAKLKAALANARSVLYLGDNAGEIVFDRLFIETMKHPNVTFAVRGEPVINDVTLEDARYVGMDAVAKVISNGHDVPSTIVDQSSAEFRQVFEKADVIISKGQGNLEGLIDTQGKEIYFLLMVKCKVIADTLKVKVGDFVVRRN